MTEAAHSGLVLVDRLFWAISGFLCIVVFILALRNKRFKTFPLFFTLVGCYPIEFVIFFTIQIVVRSYAVWSWSMSFLLVSVFLLELTVLYKLVNIIILSHASVARHLKSVLRWTFAVLVLCVTILAALGGNISGDAGVSAFTRLL